MPNYRLEGTGSYVCDCGNPASTMYFVGTRYLGCGSCYVPPTTREDQEALRKVREERDLLLFALRMLVATIDPLEARNLGLDNVGVKAHGSAERVVALQAVVAAAREACGRKCGCKVSLAVKALDALREKCTCSS